MKNYLLRFGTIAACAAFLTASPAFGAGKKKKEKEPDRQYTTIANISADSLTISEGKVTRTLAITPFTEILLKGQRAKIADLQPGMLVGITLGTDPTKLSRINAGDPPPKAPSKKK